MKQAKLFNESQAWTLAGAVMRLEFQIINAFDFATQCCKQK